MQACAVRERFGTKDAVALAVFLCLAVGTFIYARHGQPSVESVSGRFNSDCCGEVVIGRSSAAYQGQQVPLRFYHMKFGLTAYADQRLGPFFAVSGARQQPPVIYFDGPDAFMVVGYKGTPTHFHRVR
jgi:hypothetical protein